MFGGGLGLGRRVLCLLVSGAWMGMLVDGGQSDEVLARWYGTYG